MNDWLSTMRSMLRGIAGGGQRLALDSVESGIQVSTVDTADMGPETAICTPTQAIIVQRYRTRERALAGHAQWIERAKTLRAGDLVTDVGHGVIQPEAVAIAL